MLIVTLLRVECWVFGSVGSGVDLVLVVGCNFVTVWVWHGVLRGFEG
jgi:hypothetical protein